MMILSYHKVTQKKRQKENPYENAGRREFMYKVNIRTIKNTEKFIQMVENSCGRVFLELPNETLCDLKQNTAVLQMLSLIHI